MSHFIFLKYVSVLISINCFIQIELNYNKCHFISEYILPISSYYFNNTKSLNLIITNLKFEFVIDPGL